MHNMLCLPMYFNLRFHSASREWTASRAKVIASALQDQKFTWQPCKLWGITGAQKPLFSSCSREYLRAGPPGFLSTVFPALIPPFPPPSFLAIWRCIVLIAFIMNQKIVHYWNHSFKTRRKSDFPPIFTLVSAGSHCSLSPCLICHWKCQMHLKC